MVPVHRDRAADAERDADDHHQPQPADIDAEALRGLLAEAERAKGVALAQQDDRARRDERQRQHDVAKTAILQRAEQPERDFQHHEGIAGQIHHQRGRGARKAGDRKARQNEKSAARHCGRRSPAARTPRRRPWRWPRPAARRSAHRQARARSPAPRRTRPIAARRTATATPADCAAVPAAPRPTAREKRRSQIPRIVRGSRISRTITCCTSLPPPNSASITVSGDSRTGPIPSEISASNATSTTSAVHHADAPACRDIGGHHDVLNTHQSSSSGNPRLGHAHT